MKQNILRYFKHIFGTIFALLIIGLIILVSQNGSVSYGENPLRMQINQEGPYVFYENDSTLTIKYLGGNRDDGFYTEEMKIRQDSMPVLSCFFPLDSSTFQFKLESSFSIPKAQYDDGAPILAISDIEGSYKAFRDFLINAKVIDQHLNWTFGKGHLVLVGDFIDRGYSSAQVLWFIYKLEQEARKNGGFVHYILGNHELKNMQAMHESAASKYYGIAAMLGKQHHNLYDSTALIGRWMSSKNTLELINGHLFAHGGLHPDIATLDESIEQINAINRSNYRNIFYPKQEKSVEQLICSSRKGIAWYRGYFRDNLSQAEVEKSLHKFNAKAIVVGHTLQFKVNKKHEGKVFGIDVKHPKDYYKNWPKKQSEGLLIEQDTYYRVLADGSREVL